MASLAQVIEGTLSPNPETRNVAEAHLNEAWKRPEHPLQILHIVADANASMPVRQAASVHFKNLVKHGWDESEEDEARKGIVITANDRITIKENLVELMCTVPHILQAQISESISLIAQVDYPHKWDNLLPLLVQKLASPDMDVVNGVLNTANSIFKKFRYIQRTDDLYKVILYSLERFQEPLLMMFKQVGHAVDGFRNDAQHLVPRFEALRLMNRIFFSLNYQDLPEYYEDNVKDIMEIFAKYLQYKNPLLIDDDNDDEPGPVDKLQSAIIENLKLYADKDEECFIDYLPNFTSLVWNNLMSLSAFPKHDPLVTTSIKFLSSLIEKQMHSHLFNSEETLQQIVTNIVIPNIQVRESDEEKFEDDPRDFIAMEIEGSDSESRQKCSRDLLRAMCRQFGSQSTALCMGQISEMLNAYAADNSRWQAKDTAIQLMLAIAVGKESHVGVSELNPGANMMEFFSSQVLPELQDANHSTRPMVKASAIKFAFTFRNQFSKEQLLVLIPMLAAHLSSRFVVVHTLASYAIERILMTKEPSKDGEISKQFKISRNSLSPFLEPIFNGLFSIIENPDLNENEHVMKCNMRVLARAGQDVVPVTPIVFGKLAAALERVCKNPRNPEYNHHLFESIAALVRNCCSKDRAMTSDLETLLFPPFQQVLQLDILEFTPYVFQVLAQLLEFRPDGTGLGSAYTSLFKPLLSASLFQRKGNVPGLVRLLQAYLKRAAGELLDDLNPMLGIFQSLLASSATEGSAFELLRALTMYVPQENIFPAMPTVFNLMLTKLRANRGRKFPPLVVSYFALFAGMFGGTTFIEMMNRIQVGLFANFVQNVWLTHVDAALDNKLEAKIQIVGLSRLLCEAKMLLQDAQGKQLWAQTFKAVVKILLSQSFSSSQDIDEGEVDVQYDATFTRLSMATKKPDDPFAGVTDLVGHFLQAVQATSQQHPGVLGELIQASLNDDVKLSTGFQSMVEQAGASIM